MYSKILTPLDGSKTAEKALPYARSLAAKLNAPVELLGVIDVADLAAHITAERAHHIDTLIDDTTAKLDNYLKAAAASVAGAKYQVQKGRPEEVIIEKGDADKGALIAMATHGRSGMNRFLLGSVAEKVLRGTNNPLLLVRATDKTPETGTMTVKKAIVPLDGSELAEGVLMPIAELARKLDLEVVLFRAYSIPTYVYAGGDGYYAVNFDEMVAEMRDEANEYLEKKVAQLKQRGLRASAVSKEGIAADEVIALGRENPDSVIAMCSHGRSGVKRWVLGSVTETVVRHSENPVLVIRAH